MASSHHHWLGETGLSQSAPSSNHHNIPFAIPHHHAINPTSSNPFMNQGGSSFDFGELEQAIVLQGVKIGHHEPKSSLFANKPAATLEMFPSWPMRIQQTTRGSCSKSGGESTTDDSESAVNTISSSQAEIHLEQPESPMSRKPSIIDQNQQQQQQASSSYQQHQPGMSQNQSASKQPQEKRQVGSKSDKVLDAKTLRRLAQNREAARKSRLRKKAYVQQLESSRLKLAQLEQDLQRARAQGLFLGGAGGAPANISSVDGDVAGAAIFDMEYARWIEDDHRHISELRTALQTHLSDGDLRIIVDGYINHYDEIFRLKNVAAKTDIFHLITGMWTTPAERCFLWMGGFRPSELIKMLIAQLDPLTEQQLMGIYSLQQTSQQAEEALSQGLEQLQQSLVDTIATSTVTDGMHQMAIALGKLSNLEGFIRQADNLRQQTLHQLRRILTIRQAARCFLVIGEYYGRLRALSSLWASRPREQMMNQENACHQAVPEMQMVQPPHNHHFNPF
ncbi:transcription factor TGA9-like isoform X1 [Amaranthus tricolor]|uniref:transcription factor TGA9-like isoform X1 n=2 Tax=Amaranthus tricolor TaxID=29722 RepID=UPI00258A151C|nr:transcription factor TGA9-like isoform X1 [Amaranthus tricolor]